MSDLASRALRKRWSLGRMKYPSVRPRAIEAFSRLSELAWQTTRVSPGAFLSSADASVRASGTAPPAGGETDVSAAGSGQ